VDDSATIRKAVRPQFDSHPNFEVVGEAEHGCEAVEKAPNLRPDLIVLDLSMPVMNALDAAPLLVWVFDSPMASAQY
jgi:two-component system, NarL family, nitrate/nitrite response regulator NarL